MKKLIFTVTLLLLSTFSFAQKGQFETVQDYRARFFPVDATWQTLWVNKELRKDIESILDHRFSGMRIRYWGQGQKSGWIFEEIGKELPITIGVIVEAQKITDISILEYRESRGGEIRYPFFTKQFKGVYLESDERYRLSESIDGITGATLSVRAMKKIARLALYCHQQTPFLDKK